MSKGRHRRLASAVALAFGVSAAVSGIAVAAQSAGPSSSATGSVNVNAARATRSHEHDPNGHAPQAAARPARASRAALRRMRADPALDVPATPGYDTCWTARESKQCTHLELAAINHARSTEGVRPMRLPRNYSRLTSAEQTFVVTNLERTARGLRPFVALVTPLDSQASSAARGRRDPSLASWQVGDAQAWKWTANWADDVNALAADYDYMYNDGYAHSGSVNEDCTSRHAGGCWVHRHNILARYPHLPLLIAGAAEVRDGQLESSAILMVGARGPVPHASFSWRRR